MSAAATPRVLEQISGFATSRIQPSAANMERACEYLRAMVDMAVQDKGLIMRLLPAEHFKQTKAGDEIEVDTVIHTLKKQEAELAALNKGRSL